jgi:hypothetical protein
MIQIALFMTVKSNYGYNLFKFHILSAVDRFSNYGNFRHLNQLCDRTDSDDCYYTVRKCRVIENNSTMTFPHQIE